MPVLVTGIPTICKQIVDVGPFMESFRMKHRRADVDGRDKPGHDGEGG